MTLRAVNSQDPLFQAMGAALDAAGLPTGDLLEEPAVYFAAEDAAAFAGLLRLGPDALLRSLVVDPARRGGGLGAAMIEALSARAAAEGVERLWLLTTTAEGFFARQGWQTVPRASAPPAVAASRQFTRTCPDDAVLMCLTLA